MVVDRDERIVMLWSDKDDCEVQSLTIDIVHHQPRWANFDFDAYQAKEVERAQEFHNAWATLMKSLPDIGNETAGRQRQLERLRETIEFSIDDPEESFGDASNGRTDAHQAVDEISALFPFAKVSELLILISKL